MKLAQSMMKGKNLHNEFWAIAVATFVYLINRSPIKSVKMMTPYEAWNGKSPNVAHFRYFRCTSYTHVQNETRKKLDAKNEMCIFVGYSEKTKGYKLYNPTTQTFLFSCDVIFDESGVWFDDKNLL